MKTHKINSGGVWMAKCALCSAVVPVEDLVEYVDNDGGEEKHVCGKCLVATLPGINDLL